MAVNRNLIFDIGLHKGEDTAYYLAKGFHVIAFEANPELIEYCKGKFKSKMENGHLRIVEGAVVDTKTHNSDTVTFYKNENKSVWGTVVKDWSERNQDLGSPSTELTVPAVDFKKCLEDFGMPYYMKIDIEGMDHYCLEVLKEFGDKPAYISIESEKVNFHELKKEFDLFEELGYDAFKLVNQSIIDRQKEPKNSQEGKSIHYSFEPGSSGLFGQDLKGYKSRTTAIRQYWWIFLTYKIWGDHSNIRHNGLVKFLRRVAIKLLNYPVPGWFDTHARHNKVL
jgi:FkbM family methyltransferase